MKQAISNLPTIRVIEDNTGDVQKQTPQGQVFDALAFARVSGISLGEMALLYSEGLIIYSGTAETPLAIRLETLVPIVRETNLNTIDAIVRAVLQAA
jgi:hypothetical protein